MATRYPNQKPNPEIKKNVREARSVIHKTGTARAVVAGASVFATLAGFAAFSSMDAQALTASQAATTTSTQATVATTTSTQAAVATTTQPSIKLDLSGIGDFITNIVGSTGAAISDAANSTAYSQPSAFASTRSSR